MGKLYFYYGTMGASKSAEVILKYDYFNRLGKKVMLCKALIDDKICPDKYVTIESRSGLKNTQVIPIGFTGELPNFDNYDILIIDECQFLSENSVKNLRNITNCTKTLIFCYGLRTNFRADLWEGSKFLFALADTIREITAMCARCCNKSAVNARLVHGKVTISGELIQHDTRHGGNTTYQALCFNCWSTLAEY
ncbi:MAG: thymidine kinase [Candidatus Improbicoccus devescovinae]|nr:MAG: thymidine kinase [Candidatus Improbicoccus devescovinae]